MKRLVFFLLILVVFGICVNAQNLQRGAYNDGKVFAYIEQRKGTVTDYYGNGRMDILIIENISGQEINLQYVFKAVKWDDNNRFEQDKIVNQNKTLKADEKIRENGRAAYNGMPGSYFVDSFAIMNVSVNSTNQGNTGISSIQPPLTSVQSGNSWFVYTSDGRLVTSGRAYKTGGDYDWYNVQTSNNSWFVYTSDGRLVTSGRAEIVGVFYNVQTSSNSWFVYNRNGQLVTSGRAFATTGSFYNVQTSSNSWFVYNSDGQLVTSGRMD